MAAISRSTDVAARVAGLELEEAEHCDRVVFADPRALRADERVDLVRRRLGDEPFRVLTERAQVVEHRPARLLVVHLLDQVAVEIAREALGDFVVELAGARERQLHQLEHGAGDVVAGR